MADEGESSPKYDAVADYYAAGLTASQIAAQTGYGISTVYRILRLPFVRARIAENRAIKLRPILELVYGQLEPNVSTLAAIRDSELSSQRDKISAIAELNAMAENFGDIVERAGHVAHLEARAADLTPGGAPPVADDVADE